MNITVTGQNISIEWGEIVEHSQEIYTAKFEFDSSWDEYAKTAVFQINSEEPTEVVLTDGQCTIPTITKSGYLRVGVYGTSDAKVMPTVWGEKHYINRGTPTGSVYTPPTPSVYAQLLEQIQEITNMEVTAVTLETGESAYATFEDGVLTLGLPKGDKGDKGDKGNTGSTGATGNGIVSVTKTGTVGLVDTYTILFTDGDSTTFEVTNGEGGSAITNAQIDALFA